VLPFTNVGHDPANEVFCDGLAETLTSKLTQLEQFQGSLWVVPTSELRTRKVTSADQARREFGVTLAVSGSSQRDGDKVHLTLNLVDARTLRQLSSAVVDDNLANLLMLESWLVTKSAQMLRVELKPPMLDVLAAGQTRVPAAYDAYVQGRGALQNYNQLASLDAAIGSFNLALQEDHDYALAYAGLGEAYWRKYQFTRDSQWVGPARTNCERAVELNNQLSPVYVTLGIIHEGTGEYADAVTEFRRALDLDPLSVSAYNGLAQAYDHMGNGGMAEINYKRSIDLQPDYFAGYYLLGRFYYSHGRYTDALTPFDRVFELTPDSYRAANNLGVLYVKLERWPDAKVMFERSVKLEPNYGACSNLGTIYFHEARYSDAANMYEKALESDSREYKVVGNLASAYHWIPNEEKAQVNYRRAVQMAEGKRQINPHDGDVLSDLAVYYGMTGERARALQLIEQALEQSPDDVDVLFRAGEVYEHLGEREKALKSIGMALDHGCSRETVEVAPELRRLRADSRFAALIQQHQH
jgi:tetratricopeptide (TPR) repeat protein